MVAAAPFDPFVDVRHYFDDLAPEQRARAEAYLASLLPGTGTAWFHEPLERRADAAQTAAGLARGRTPGLAMLSDEDVARAERILAPMPTRCRTCGHTDNPIAAALLRLLKRAKEGGTPRSVHDFQWARKARDTILTYCDMLEGSTPIPGAKR